MARKSISKKLRFDVFKRDAFRCQYCGRTPPNITLELDHFIPVAEGGTNDIDNLLTSCFDCNRGKSSNLIEQIPPTIKTRQELLKEQESQSREYNRWLKQKRKRQENDVDSVEDIFSRYHAECFTERFRSSVKTFIGELSLEEVQDAMEKAAAYKDTPEHACKYFCGICWNKIRSAGT